jgi:hypothetical protein
MFTFLTGNEKIVSGFIFTTIEHRTFTIYLNFFNSHG